MLNSSDSFAYVEPKYGDPLALNRMSPGGDGYSLLRTYTEVEGFTGRLRAITQDILKEQRRLEVLDWLGLEPSGKQFKQPNWQKVHEMVLHLDRREIRLSSPLAIDIPEIPNGHLPDYFHQPRITKDKPILSAPLYKASAK